MSDPTIFGMSDHEWGVINGLANWFAAFGTIAVVVVSLWLARRQNRPRVNVRAEVSTVWFEKGSDKNREYLVVRAVNVGDRPVTITHLSLRFGLFRKLWVGIPLPDPDVSSSFPVELAYGKEASWYFPLETKNHKWREGVASFLGEAEHRVRVSFASVFATTATGETLKAQSGSGVAIAFSKAVENAKPKG